MLKLQYVLLTSIRQFVLVTAETEAGLLAHAQESELRPPPLPPSLAELEPPVGVPRGTALRQAPPNHVYTSWNRAAFFIERFILGSE